MNGEEVLSPAKINLLLAITGRRTDGFHELISLVVPLDWGDRLALAPGAAGRTELECDDPAVPTGEGNLIVKAANAFRAATGWDGGARFQLTKKIPMGAGLGGGSSNAASALLLLNRMSGGRLDADGLAAVAATVGSDCPLFLAGGAAIMRGRGERIEPLAPNARRRLAGVRVLVFKPAFGVPTAWAYGRLARGGRYDDAAAAERRLADWQRAGGADIAPLLQNTMEAPVFEKFPALPLLLSRIGGRFGLAVRMSGSGSACFAVLPARWGDGQLAELMGEIRSAWGPSACIQPAALAA